MLVGVDDVVFVAVVFVFACIVPVVVRAICVGITASGVCGVGDGGNRTLNKSLTTALIHLASGSQIA